MAAKVVTLTIFIITMIEAAMNGDRYVVRENNPVDMDCNHGLENVTRVRWEYISTYDIRSEIIYDSQFNKQLKDGFEVSCQPHQTFISTCTLKLTRASEKDAGKYICYVEEGSDAKIDSNLKPDIYFLKPIIEVELVIRGPLHKMMVANRGDSVILPCEHNGKNITRTRWSHISLQGVLNYNLYYMNGKATTTPNYVGDCGPHKPYCNLKILQANKESTGRYICMVGESQEFEDKYGLFQMTYFIEIQLVVGELLCNDGLTEDQILIGENDCYGIEADVLNLKCSFNYFGNINYNLLCLRWIEKYKFNSLKKKLNSSLINHEVKDETKKISIQTSLVVALEHKNSLFQCILDDSLIKPCQLHGFKTQFVKNITRRSPAINSNDLHNIKCSANKSENVHCSYYWVHEVGGAMVQNPYAILPVEHMNSPGNYTCIAKCHLGKEKECIIKAMELEIIIEPRLSGLNIGLMAALIATLAILIAVMVVIPIILVRMKKKNSTVKDEGKTEEQKVNTKLLETESFTNVHIKKTEVLFQKKVNDEGHVKIQESPMHGIELTIDDVIYEREKDYVNELEILSKLQVSCHQNPKNILLIGIGTGRIVKGLLELLENKKFAEFKITVFESNKEIYELYCEYFPSLAGYLEHPKVELIIQNPTEKSEIDGIEFIKRQENAFDVIINHTHAEVDKHLITKRYFEELLRALKEGGIVSLIFIGDTIDNILEQAESNCYEHFPKVEVFPSNDNNCSNAVFKFLACTYNLDIDLCKLKEAFEDEIKSSVPTNP